MEQTQLLLGVFLSVTLCSIGANARVFSNCSLAQELVNTHNISRATVGESLIDDNIADDVACIKKVIGSTRAGFAVFPSWMQKCRAGSRRNGNADWVAGCF
ncbi:unnamed protein product [Notodromas monacha]|uniref:Lysozyme n=1 Tax=Notodromas monacha TaxID=399045 RepID=A0A7R9BLG2_9CRUS|nr:unnamed protein product [Notodromas monacha]CAG0916866.1 unnamed protein product [Notodromas monacha]